MNATATTPEHPAPAFAGRFTLIIADLVALIARAFLRDPKLVPLIIPLCRRLNRTVRHLSTIMTVPATGQPPRRCRPGRSGGRGPKPPIPATHAWLVVTLRHEAAGYASQLSHLLNEPGVPELLAAAPTAARLLRPLCRMLGLAPAAPGAVGRDKCASSQTESAEPPPEPPPPSPPPRRQNAPIQTSGSWPDSTWPSTPPPCPHVRWPWFQHPRAKPT